MNVIDKDIMVRSIGMGYILLGVYYFFGNTWIDGQVIASLSISAFLFVLSDCFQVYSEKYSNKRILNFFQYLAILLNAIAMMFVIVIPFLKLRFDEQVYDIIGTTLLLIGLGLSIYLIAKKNEKRTEARYAEILNTIEEGKRLNNEIKEVIFTFNKDLKEQVELMTAREEPPIKK